MDELEDISDDNNIQLFLVNPNSQEELEKTIEFAKSERKLYFSIPSISYVEDILGAVAIHLIDKDSYEKIVTSTLPIIVENMILDDELMQKLVYDNKRVIVLNAQRTIIENSSFYFTISEELYEHDDTVLKDIHISRLLLGSSYPTNGFDIFDKNIKKISNAIFRPEPTIMNNIIKNSFECFNIQYQR